MDSTYIPSGGPIAGWLIFIAILLGICLVLTPIVIWVVLFKKKGGRRRRRHRHHDHYRRKTNPTLDQTGGLPPPRDPNQLPPGL